MAIHYFLWNGTDSRNKHIRVHSAIPVIRPEERIRQITIPGRSGDLTETEGADIFNSYIQTVSISVKGAYNVRNIYRWLRGAGFVTFSGEPDRKQAARVIGAITLNRVSRNIDHWAGEVQFYCQPLKEKLAEEKVTVSSSGANVYNAGDVTARPLWKVTASGSTVVVSCGGKTITCTDYTSGQVLLIDSENYTIYNSDQTADWTKWSSGDFPVLAPGANTVTGSGWSSIEITKRERYL